MVANALLVALRGVAERGLGRGEAGDRDAERRARHVVEPDPLALGDRLRVAAVLAADPELEVRACVERPLSTAIFISPATASSSVWNGLTGRILSSTYLSRKPPSASSRL